MINPGDIFWYKYENILHPYLVIELMPLKLCAITSNKKKANMPGNILLDELEGNLPKQSVIEVYKTKIVLPEELGEYIGKLSEERVEEVFKGINFIQRTYF